MAIHGRLFQSLSKALDAGVAAACMKSQQLNILQIFLG